MSGSDVIFWLSLLGLVIGAAGLWRGGGTARLRQFYNYSRLQQVSFIIFGVSLIGFGLTFWGYVEQRTAQTGSARAVMQTWVPWIFVIGGALLALMGGLTFFLRPQPAKLRSYADQLERQGKRELADELRQRANELEKAE